MELAEPVFIGQSTVGISLFELETPWNTGSAILPVQVYEDLWLMVAVSSLYDKTSFYAQLVMELLLSGVRWSHGVMQ